MRLCALAARMSWWRLKLSTKSVSEKPPTSRHLTAASWSMFKVIVIQRDAEIKKLQSSVLMNLGVFSVFKKELEKDVAGDTSGDFAKLLLALVQVRLNCCISVPPLTSFIGL